MASDRSQFKQAVRKHNLLLDQRDLSMPVDIGRTAILCSYDVTRTKQKRPVTKERVEFRKEAFAIADCLLAMGDRPEVILNCQESDIKKVLTDPGISSVVTIGHGSLRTFHVADGTEDVLDWTYVSATADHLKTGYFEQRQCGHYYEHMLPVPFGLFSLTNHASLVASVGHFFNGRGLKHEDNRLIRPFMPDRDLTYGALREMVQIPEVQTSN